MLLGLALAAAGCGSSSNGSVPGSGTGGAGGTAGGSGGTTGAFDPTTPIPATGTVLETFDTSVDGFKINSYVDTGATNLGADGGVNATGTLAEWDGTVGSPTVGSLKITAPFSDWNQYVDVLKSVSPMADWSGKKIHVRVMVDSGFDTDMYVKGFVQMYFDTGTSYAFGQAATVPTVNSNAMWQEFVLDTTTATFPTGTVGDPTMVVQYGVQFQSGAGNTTAVKPSAGVFHVDSFWLE
ncbi:MAG TPA: hypothetical protein VGP07_17460 [Polyangia bacterium]|jgi:hypothetical protein